MDQTVTQPLALDRINAIAELERLKWPFEAISDVELKLLCPFHKDQSPSATMNTSKRVFNCKACKARGDLVTFIARVKNLDRAEVLTELGERYDLSSDKPISIELVEKFHSAIWSSKDLLSELRKRGVPDSVIRERRLGVDVTKGRVTIPVPNESGLYVNVRFYLPGAPGPEKMRNAKGRGEARLYPLDQLQYERVVICGGELKALVAAHHLNPRGIGAITCTAGEGNWDPRFSKKFRGKEVYICQDVDVHGEKASQHLGFMVHSEARSTKIVNLASVLPPDKWAKGDINDYFGQAGGSAEEFVGLLEVAAPWTNKKAAKETTSEEPLKLTLAQSLRAENAGRRVEVSCVVRALDITPYLVPKTVRCGCTRDQPQCAECPVYAETPDNDGIVKMTIHGESLGLMNLTSSSRQHQNDLVRDALGIPECKVLDIAVDEYYSIEDARLSPQIDISDRSTEREMVPAFIVGAGLELNSGYKMRGRVYPHPRTQQATFLVSEFAASDDALSNYTPSEEDLQELARFTPGELTVDAIEEKLTEIYDDFSANVTRIYQRRDLHLLYDLAYHSPLFMRFDGATVKGWAEVLVVGDSSQGKSETSTCLMRHYGLGERVDCKNASVAGLLGGLQSMGTRFFVSWGVIPTHDKRLIILEELKGASTEVIGRLTDMRSSGVAEIPKIEKRRTRARTRLIGISNPRSGSAMATYNFGVDAIKEVIGGAEDIRRFDACMVVTAGQVDPRAINALQRSRPSVEHRFTSDLCRRLILWAWTRRDSGVVFTHDAHERVMDHSAEFCARYSESIPIVDRGSFRFKLARLSAALAARLFSRADDALEVHAAHVDYVAAFLKRIYDDPHCGYLAYSKSATESERIGEPDAVKKQLYAAPYCRDLVEALLATNEIQLQDICDLCGWDRGDAQKLLSLLVRKRALRREARAYRKTTDFITLLREMLNSKEMELMSRPGFAKDIEDGEV